MMVRSCLCVSSIIFILTSQNNAQAFFHVPKKTNGVRNSDSYVLLHRRELFGIVANQGRVIGDNFCVPGGAVLPASGSISSYGLSPPISGTRLHAVPQKRIARRDLKKVCRDLTQAKIMKLLRVCHHFLSVASLIFLFNTKKNHRFCDIAFLKSISHSNT